MPLTGSKPADEQETGMRIYSNVLTSADLDAAIRAANERTPTRDVDPFYGLIGFERCLRLNRTRIRARGWDVLLYRTGSTMHFNSGQHGAGEEGAASWDDWGWFLAELYLRDPVMRAGSYNGEAEFHRATRNGFKPEDKGGSPRLLSPLARQRLRALGLTRAAAALVLAEARRSYGAGTPVDSAHGTYVVTYGNKRYQITREPAAGQGDDVLRQVPAGGPCPDPLVFG
jgi:hypothetical protein